MLRAELKQKDNELALTRSRSIAATVDGHNAQLESTRRAAATAEAEMLRMKEETASSVAVLRGELELYRVRACEAEAELDLLRQDKRSSSGGSSRTSNGSASRPGSALGNESNRRLGSFRVPIEEETGLPPKQQRGGTPMRPGASASSSRVTIQKLPQGVSGRQDSFFKDLNPLK